ncbi:NUDIX domain-containing protein [Microbacterium sp. 22242]|uniref:NUDIX domain-containing protein n=1 Tax=Microbacterium sp. 22242 TaxID=3453896 RepID=UPI003F849A51
MREPFALIPAAYVYLRRGDEVLLQLRQNTGYMDGTWAAAVAGHVEPGESAAATACREAAEELAVVLAPEALIPLTVLQRTDGTADAREQRVDWFFTAERWDGAPRIAEPDKCAEIAWFPLAALPARMPPHERAVLERLAAGTVEPFAAYGFRSPADATAVGAG